MNFKIEYSDEHFRLIIVNPSGEQDFLEAVLFCSVSSVVGPDGVVYGAYLNGSENDLETLSAKDDTTMISHTIKVYDLTSWPTLKPVPGTVTLEEVDFPDVEGEDDGQSEEDGAIVDVEPVE